MQRQKLAQCRRDYFSGLDPRHVFPAAICGQYAVRTISTPNTGSPIRALRPYDNTHHLMIATAELDEREISSFFAALDSRTFPFDARTVGDPAWISKYNALPMALYDDDFTAPYTDITARDTRIRLIFGTPNYVLM